MKKSPIFILFGALILNACIPVAPSIPTLAIETTISTTSVPIDFLTPVSTIHPTPEMWEEIDFLTIRLNDMTILPDMEIWAVGDPGIIIHDYYRLEIKGLNEEQNGGLDLRTLGSLNAIDFIFPDDGWIISSKGGIFHWNGNEWTTIIPADPDAYHSLSDIEFADTDSGWAVGCLGSAAQYSISSGDKPVMLQWNGAEWQDISSVNKLNTNDCLYSIDVISENDVWILGDHYIDGAIVLHWDGLEWQRVPVLESMHGKNNISASGDTNVWVVADTGNIGTNAFYWNGTTWQKMEIPFPELPYLVARRTPEILAFAPDDVWVGGSGVFHWDGYEWKVIMPYNEKFGFVKDMERISEGTIWVMTQTGKIFELKLIHD